MSDQADRKAIDEELTRLHGQSRHAARLSKLHEIAATDFAETPAEARFHVTHAWVFALVDGDSQRAEALEARLRALGGL